MINHCLCSVVRVGLDIMIVIKVIVWTIHILFSVVETCNYPCVIWNAMDFVSPIIDILTRLQVCTANCRGYINHFEENLESLRNLLHELESIHKKIWWRVEHEEQHNCYLQCTWRVNKWLGLSHISKDYVSNTLWKGNKEMKKKG